MDDYKHDRKSKTILAMGGRKAKSSAPDNPAYSQDDRRHLLQIVGKIMGNKHIWNLTQNLRAVLNLRPMNCWCKAAQAYSCKPGQTFLCEVCSKEQPYCRGMDDAYGEICDRCWAVANAAHEAANHSLDEWAKGFGENP